MAVSTLTVLAVAFVVPTTPRIQADVERGSGFGLALGNDYLSFEARGNDRGFTSDVDVYLLSAAHNGSVRVGMRHSIFTADTPSEPMRFDIGRLYVEARRRVTAVGVLALSWTHFAEGLYRGDLGGSDMQNFVHHWPGIEGETFGNGLSDDYPTHARLGVSAGLGWRADVDLSSFLHALDASWWVSTMAQVAPLATGVTKIEASAGLHVEASVSSASSVFTETQLSAGRAVSNDPFLQLPGGYTNELGALWGPTVVIGLRLRTSDGDWIAAFFCSTRNPEGTGTRRGSGPMGWLVIEWGHVD
jgi:hypothetical protein